MTSRWAEHGQPYRVAGALFDTLSAADRLLAHGPNVRRGISPAELAAYVADPDHPRADEIFAAIGSNLRLRRDFRFLLARNAAMQMPKLAAASTGAITQREGEGCRIAFRPSRADPNQVYIIVSFDSPKAQPKELFVCLASGECLRQVLPEIHGQTAQLIAEEGGALLMALRDVDAEVFLR